MTNFFRILIIAFSIVGFHHQLLGQELRVALVSLGETNPRDLVIATNAISSKYKAQFKNLSAISIEDSMKASYLSPNYDGTSGTEVLNAVTVLKILSKLNEQDKNNNIYIGITNEALTTQAKVARLKKQIIRGLGGAIQKAAIISTYKVSLETVIDQEYQNVLSKVVNHEMGHILGLGHCEDNEQCLMVNAANFHKSTPDFCSSCLEKIDNKYLNLN